MPSNKSGPELIGGGLPIVVSQILHGYTFETLLEMRSACDRQDSGEQGQLLRNWSAAMILPRNGLRMNE